MTKKAKIIAFILMIVSVIGCLPLLAERWQAEHSDNKVEFAVPGAWILGPDGKVDINQAKRWKQGGATTVMLDNSSLPADSRGLDGQLPETYRAAAAALRQEGLQVTAYVRPEAVPVNEPQLDEMFQGLFEAGIDRVQFAGMEIPGYPDQLKPLGLAISGHGLHSVLVKSQKGALELSRQSDYMSIRSLFFDRPKLSAMNVREAADAFELGVRERGIRLITFMPGSSGEGNAPDGDGGVSSAAYEEHAGNIIKALRTELGENYRFGGAAPISTLMETPGKLARILPVMGIGALFLLLGSCLFGFLSRTMQGAVIIAVTAATVLLTAAWLFAPDPWAGRTQSVIALWGAISAPTAAVLWLRERLKRRHDSRLSDGQSGMGLLSAIAAYIGALAITSAGIVYVTSLLSDISYLAYVDLFRGVKLLYVGPIALITACLLLDGGWQGMRSKPRPSFPAAGGASGRRRIWLGGTVLLAVAALLVFLLVRTGNSDLVLPYEGELRQLLTDWFGIRPRTKEWLIGHPLLMAAACLLACRNRGAVILPVAAIGLCSMMNTFTHLHSPLAVSLTRSWTGALFGGLIGLTIYLLLFRRSDKPYRY
ncbi:DUF5693 family protein [Paenibacillus nasutitermitis]|uniref:Uncharacterized protein n=1 Tax=Paenibacillus nasutitermitis TaxID=1652958 RepID=A0A916ZD43_9BACL|nr:DUF5693 family protein [Paenibacillus nasutitermitis]GGD87022.1 hypothetical protein GCM10010911_51830 [Paenibacillus nasutitermitis]